MFVGDVGLVWWFSERGRGAWVILVGWMRYGWGLGWVWLVDCGWLWSFWVLEHFGCISWWFVFEFRGIVVLVFGDFGGLVGMLIF